MNLLLLLLQNPVKTLQFAYTWTTSSFLVILQSILLPHYPEYQSLRTRLHRAYLSSAYLVFPHLTHRLPVGSSVPESRAYPVKDAVHNFNGYLIPGTKRGMLKDLCEERSSSSHRECVTIIYAHGGGYSAGEARMYLPYMERWEKAASDVGLEVVFLSVEYPLSDGSPHPAQRDAFLGAYRYLLDLGVPAQQIVFMGDSAGAGCCVLSGIHCLRLGLPQPACTVLHSPWLDPSMPAHEGGNALVATDYVVKVNAAVPKLWDMWLDGASSTSPDTNPLYNRPSEIYGLNPQLILVGGGEFALQEAKDWKKLCDAAAVDSRLICEPGQMHIYSLGSKWLAPGVRKRTDEAIFGWIMEKTSRQSNTTL
ncbi:hypothetical protein FE257_007857 [Aspergillus nanangensis]|uniref:Alpha/beta hydrolase fold-3 domain-containing protein n=1 Tax=Aspergillus nanangensis TaxID=2582783 RepID=A0AAD4CX60_ASPNN|nr:hypothetical protein FE257_007857 [Aspergillus nanangensis]